MSTLPEIIAEYNSVMELLYESGGEISESIDKALALISEKAAEKVDSFKFILDKLEAEAEFWKKEAEERAKMAKNVNAARDRLEDFLKKVMESNNLNEIAGGAFKVKLQPTQGSVVYDDNLIGPEYMIETKTYTVDKKKIRQDIDLGKNVIGAQLKPGVSLRFYKAKK